MLFPAFDKKPFARINLDEEAARWPSSGPNPLLDPATCDRMVAEVHQRKGVAWSYGGYLEDRRRLWRGSYLEKTGAFIHLGVDFNVPAGTELVSGHSATVLLVDDDGDRDGGWGTRMIIEPAIAGHDIYLIYAHIQNVRFQAGDEIDAGDVLGEVGGPPDNGNWYPHLHVQSVLPEYFDQVMLDNFEQLDGYGRAEDIETLRRRFPDPLQFLRI